MRPQLTPRTLERGKRGCPPRLTTLPFPQRCCLLDPWPGPAAFDRAAAPTSSIICLHRAHSERPNSRERVETASTLQSSRAEPHARPPRQPWKKQHVFPVLGAARLNPRSLCRYSERSDAGPGVSPLSRCLMKASPDTGFKCALCRRSTGRDSSSSNSQYRARSSLETRAASSLARLARLSAFNCAPLVRLCGLAESACGLFDVFARARVFARLKSPPSTTFGLGG